MANLSNAQKKVFTEEGFTYCWSHTNGNVVAANEKGMFDVSVSGRYKRRKLNFSGNQGLFQHRCLDYWCATFR